MDGHGVVRAVPQEEAAEAMAWLSARGDREAALGYHPDGWPDSVWILHAMYEQPAPDVSANGFRRELIVEPSVLPGLDVAAYSTGIPFGFTETPGEGWTRLTWRSLTERLGRRLGEGMTYPPDLDWFPFRRWPASIRPPAEGSLTESDVHALAEVLTDHSGSTPDQCLASYGYLSYGVIPAGDDAATLTVCAGPWPDFAALLLGLPEAGSSPSNVWPADRSWFVSTNWDLMATRISGSRELITAVEAHPGLETLRWTGSTAG